MSLFSTHLLHLTVFLPLVFAGLLWLLPAPEKGQIRVITLIAMLLDFVLGIVVYLGFDANGPEFQYVFQKSWIESLGISFHTGVDGLSISLLLLTTFLGPTVVLASMSSVQYRVKEFHVALLLLQTAMMGALISLDLVLFYVFWEAMLIPMYLLIGVWGSEERQMAAMKFFLYTLVGSLLMLVALLAVYIFAGAKSFGYADLYNSLLGANREIASCMRVNNCDRLAPMAAALKSYGPWLFAAFALAFAIKVPVFPFHTWLPDAHVQAPVAGSMILAGVMLKMGTFGFWRYAMPLFPTATSQHRMIISVLAVIGIVYGAFMCLAQKDIKKLIAYSSVSHLGYCMLGMFALTTEAATGSAYQMLNHGISTGALFLLFGMLYERRHSRLMADFGGIAKVMPMFAATFLIITFSSIAVPGTNGFIGEFLVLLGSFKSSLPMVLSVLATTGVILGAAYMLWMVQRVFFGPMTLRENQHLSDLNFRELSAAVPFILLVLAMGLYPQPFLDRLAPSAERFIARANFGMPGGLVPDDRVRVPSQLAMNAAPLPEGKLPKLVPPVIRNPFKIMPGTPTPSPTHEDSH